MGHVLLPPPPKVKAGDYAIGPGEILILPPGYEFQYIGPPLDAALANCRNCGAPPESICSYCRTPNPVYAALIPPMIIRAPDFDEVDR